MELILLNLVRSIRSMRWQKTTLMAIRSIVEGNIQDGKTDVVFEMKLPKERVQDHSRELNRNVHLHPGNINFSEVKDLKIHVKTGDKVYTTLEPKRK